MHKRHSCKWRGEEGRGLGPVEWALREGPDGWCHHFSLCSLLQFSPYTESAQNVVAIKLEKLSNSFIPKRGRLGEHACACLCILHNFVW